jgi:hypothetical protein
LRKRDIKRNYVRAPIKMPVRALGAQCYVLTVALFGCVWLYT